MYASQGIRTTLVCCTGGEEGELQNPALREPGGPFHGLDTDQEKAMLTSLRPEELRRAVEIIGYHSVHMLGYRDSGMAGAPSNAHPDCFAAADLDEAAGRLVAIIRSEQPHVIVTYNDDQTGYPHPDHLRVHDVSVLAFERAGDPQWYPEAGAPWSPAKMYYTLWSAERIRKVHDAVLAKHGESPFDDNWLARPSQDHRITTRLDVGAHLGARSAALRAHATQIDPASKWWFGLDDDELAHVYPWEDWVLAASHVGMPATVPETDFFAGLRTAPATHGASAMAAGD